MTTILEENSGTFQELFKDFQLPFPDLFQQRFTTLESVYGFV